MPIEIHNFVLTEMRLVQVEFSSHLAHKIQ